MVWHKMLYGEAKLEKLFDGFKRSLWSILAMLGLMVPGIVIGMVACLPLVLVPVLGAFGGGEAAVGGLIIVIALIVLIAAAGGVVLSGVIFFMFAHIAARNANPLEALSASWEVVRRNFVMFCWVGLVYGLISSAGSLVCGVGLLVTYPLIIAAHAKAYADHFGIEVHDKETLDRMIAKAKEFKETRDSSVEITEIGVNTESPDLRLWNAYVRYLMPMMIEVQYFEDLS
ncbi:MAG: hypothetical protein IIB12_07725 [Chloroflexi bacterium]|nr:hypothetical protein [Chloroflexota bacterium]